MAEPSCGLRLYDDPEPFCGAPASYVVYGVTCGRCNRYGHSCSGHFVCEQHAADLRAGTVEPSTGEVYRVERIHTLAGVA